MRHKNITYITFFCFIMFFISCQSQKKGIHENVSNFFDFEKEYYFDIDNKIPFQTYLVDSIGQFTINYYSESNELINDYLNFEKKYKISSIYSEIDDTYYYSANDIVKIDKILRNKIRNNAKYYKIIGIYVPLKFINRDSKEEYSVLFPYEREIYSLNKTGNWFFVKKQIISNYNEDDLLKVNK